ncbi:MAG: Protein GrpE [Candidatus Falkowbacteria bacterium GW2011_GWA2_39_24]|uniref:Protein GrpE n=1 Tax=Candidatus Falkowbacteria bacterium GW2011_GWA2_39_24 TaxID=1618634 RepID=A0A0G0NPC0_9BACT|nr:MAG: Protein GrpE [Candidatus Falkowbacteria bacterium GW2011_GWA2_39_24]
MDKKKDKTINPAIDWQNKYQRALADYQNLSKQQAREQLELIKYATSSLLQDLLPVYSHLKLSLQHASAEDNSWLQGVQYVLKQFKDVLAVRGVQEVITEGQVFNHQTMEAVNEVMTSNQSLDHQVAKELSAGYTLQDRTIIPAKVSVYKYISEQAEIDSNVVDSLPNNN